jgi:transcriptional regulator with XRE-family HTH domain
MENSKSIKTTFGNRIRQLRLGMGLSQEAFADKCGVDRTYMSGIERGTRNPTLVVIYTISVALEMDLSQLFAFSDETVKGDGSQSM